MFNCNFIRRKWNLNDGASPILSPIINANNIMALGMRFFPGKMEDGGEIMVYNGNEHLLLAKKGTCKSSPLSCTIELSYGMICHGIFDDEIKIEEETKLNDILKSALSKVNGKYAIVFFEGTANNIFGKYLSTEKFDEKPFENLSYNFASVATDNVCHCVGFGIISEEENEIISPFLMKNPIAGENIDYHLHVHFNEGKSTEKVLHLVDLTIKDTTLRFGDISSLFLQEF